MMLPKKVQQDPAIKIIFGVFVLVSTFLAGLTSSFAQSVVPAMDGTDTLVTPTPDGTQLDIQGGTRSGQNLFHHFSQFSPQNQNVNFNLQDPAIQNILGRVSDGDVSYINGIIRVTGGSANLFLINPAGIIFGNNARLEVPASFTATTATRLKLGENWFNAIGSNDYVTLVGTPSEYAFGTTNPGAIVNSGNLSVPTSQSLSLIGGVVANTGTLSAPAGQITVQAVPGSSRVQMSLPNSSLILEFEAPDLPFTPRTLPQLLTGTLPVPVQGLQAEGEQIRLTTSNRTYTVVPGSAIVGGKVRMSGAEEVAKEIIISGNTVVVDPGIDSTNEIIQSGDSIRIYSRGDVTIFGGISSRNTIPAGTPNISEAVVPEAIVIDAQGDINLRNCLSSSTCLESFGGRGVKLISRGGNISAPRATINTSGTSLPNTRAGNIDIQAYGDVNISNLWARDENINGSNPTDSRGIRVESITGLIDLREGFVDTGDSQSGQQEPGKQPYSERAVPITIKAEKSIYTGNIDISSGLQGSTLTIVSNKGNIDTTSGSIFAYSNGGSSNLSISASNGNVNLAEVRADGQTSGGTIGITAQNLQVSGNLKIGSVSGDPGSIDLNVSGSVQLPEQVFLNRANVTSITPLTSLLGSAGGSQINTGGGSISLNFSSDYTLAPNLSILTNGGDVRFTSAGALTISGNLDTRSATGNGGSIFLQSGNTIATNDLVTTGDNNGGTVTLIAPTSITTGNINASGVNGNGGNVLLDPLQDVQVGWINTQGGKNGVGGNVDIVSIQGFFRSTNKFLASSGADASISTIGGLGGGSITITHNGGDLFVPFNVTNLARNGTQGVLTTGSETIANGVFPGPYQQGNIRLITSSRFTTTLADSLLDGNPRDRLTVETGGTLFPLEEKFTREFDKDAKVLTLEEMQSTLRKVEDSVGVKPALIYVSYASVPSSMPDTCTPGKMVKDEQNPGKMKECACKDVEIPPNSNDWQKAVMEVESLPCDRLTLTMVTSSGAPTYIPLSKVPRHQVGKVASEFRRLIQKKEGKDTYKPVSQILYAWLVEPLQRILQEKKINNLSYLMPDQLRLVPFAALLDKEDKFLIETYSTGLMPSLSLVDTRQVEIKQRSILAIGLSRFAPNQDQSPLQFTEVEIDAIPQQLWNVRTLRNEGVIFSQLSQPVPYGIVHFATHGAFGNGYPEGMIQIWDQKLLPQEMRKLDWYSHQPIELMVLSACETANGTSEAELGFAGSAHRFGVKSVLGSLWTVQDNSTSDLMKEFYTFLKTAPTKADALAKAQQALIKDYNYGPLHWSAFTLIGNPW